MITKSSSSPHPGGEGGSWSQSSGRVSQSDPAALRTSPPPPSLSCLNLLKVLYIYRNVPLYTRVTPEGRKGRWVGARGTEEGEKVGRGKEGRWGKVGTEGGEGSWRGWGGEMGRGGHCGAGRWGGKGGEEGRWRGEVGREGREGGEGGVAGEGRCHGGGGEVWVVDVRFWERGWGGEGRWGVGGQEGEWGGEVGRWGRWGRGLRGGGEWRGLLGRGGEDMYRINVREKG